MILVMIINVLVYHTKTNGWRASKTRLESVSRGLYTAAKAASLIENTLTSWTPLRLTHFLKSPFDRLTHIEMALDARWLQQMEEEIYSTNSLSGDPMPQLKTSPVSLPSDLDHENGKKIQSNPTKAICQSIASYFFCNARLRLGDQKK